MNVETAVAKGKGRPKLLPSALKLKLESNRLSPDLFPRMSWMTDCS